MPRTGRVSTGPDARLPVLRAGGPANAGTIRAQSSGPAADLAFDSGGTATQRIVEAITLAIIERRLMPGTKLAEQKIADVFQVSRTLVRQALNQLSRDRLVTLEPARGAFVAAPGVAEARQVFEARQMLEDSVIRRLCRTITREQVAQLRHHLKAEQAAVLRTDVPGRTRLLADFHVVLARMIDNEVVAALTRDLLTRSSLIALMYQSTHSAQASFEEHVAIVDALERRDLRHALRLTSEHLGNVERNLRLDHGGADLADLLRPVQGEVT